MNEYSYHGADDQDQTKKRNLVDALGGGPAAAGAPMGIAAPPLDPGSVQGPPLENGGPLVSSSPGGALSLDKSKWNTDGYASPNRVAQNFGNAPTGFDPAKWADANHQTPKYVSTRLMTEAGDQKDAANRQKYLDAMKEAYGADNFRFNGKDKISIDGGKSFVDVWGGSKAGIYSPAWQDESQQGGPTPAGGAWRPSFAGSTIAPMLQGDAQGSIQQALGNIGGLSNSNRIQELIAALAGGQQ